MRIYDISQEVFSCCIYPGDPKPKRKVLSSIKDGDSYNLTEFSMCAHNGTHVDAPFHFIQDGKTVDKVSLNVFVGKAYVAEHRGRITREDAIKIIDKAKKQDSETAKRILIKGDAEITEEAACIFALSGILLIGNESQTVGPENAPIKVHKILLEADIVLLEGVRLADISEGEYFLSAAPLNLYGSDGSPCRALLISDS